MTERQPQIDLMKGFFVIFMILGHMGQILGRSLGLVMVAGASVLYPGVFSGFFFCFGFAVWWSYFQRPKFRRKRMLGAALGCFAAYVVSGSAYQILLAGEKPGLDLILRVSFLREIPFYSEFLLSFSAVILIAALCPALIRVTTRNARYLAISSLLCLLLAHFHANQSWPPVAGLFIGQLNSSCYPVLLYLPLFLLGAFVARHKLRYNLFAAALAFVASALFVASEFYSVPHLTPRRFPPNAIWIVGSACIVYLFLGLATISAAKAHRAAQRYLNALGQSVLYYLVLSNLVIFALAALGLKQGLNLHSGLIVYVILMAFLFFLQSIVTDYRRATEVFDRRLDQPRRVGTLSGRLADSAQDAGHGRATQEEARHSAYEEARHSAYEEARHST
jgi:hypothetical protein